MTVVTFDIAASSAGPGRYVTSVQKGLREAGRFDVRSSGEGDANAHATSAGPPTTPRRDSGLCSFAKSLVPPQAKVVFGARREARATAASLRDRGIHVFHTQTTGCETVPIAARWAGIPIVLGTFHTDSTYDLDRERDGWGHRLIERYSNRCLDHAIAVSEATKRDWVHRTGIPEHRVTTVYNGVCPETYRRTTTREAARGELGLPADRTLIGAVGRLDRAKGHGDLIRAVHKIAGRSPEVDVVIAGGGPLREELEALAADLGLSQRVLFLGQVAAIGKLYDALDVYAMPSLCEAHPYALLEATAHGLPSVASRAGGMPETVVDGETGFLVDVGDADALANALSRLLASQEVRERFGAAARRRIEQHFTEDQMIRQTLAVYERLIEQRQTHPDRTT